MTLLRLAVVAALTTSASSWFAVTRTTSPFSLRAEANNWPEWEAQTRVWAETVARLVMQGSNVTPGVPAARMERLQSHEEEEEWCARGSSRAQRLTDRDISLVGRVPESHACGP